MFRFKAGCKKYFLPQHNQRGIKMCLILNVNIDVIVLNQFKERSV